MKFTLLPFIFIVSFFFFSCSNSQLENRELRNQLAPDDLSYFQRLYPYDKINAKQVLSSRRAVEKMSKMNHRKTEKQWKSMGPTNIGGRITDIARHPSDSELFYIGTSVGGVWKTEDGGQNWLPLFDDIATPSIGNIAISPSNPNVLYVGTGEANASAVSGAFIGSGVYRTSDAGLSWESVGLEETQHVARIVIDQNDPNLVYAAATGSLYGKDDNRGLFRSIDGGQNWDKIFFVSDSTACIDVAVSPSDPNVIYTAMWERIRFPWIRDYGGLTSAIHRSLDGGHSWERMDNGLTDNFKERGRIGLTVSKVDPNKVFAVITTNEITNILEGVYMSDNKGETWQNVSGNIFDIRSQPFSSFGWFFGNIRVNPFDDNNLVVLGLDAFISNISVTNWRLAGGMHVDMHAMEFFERNSNDMLVGNDGGLYRSLNGGVSFSFISNLPITQFYNIEVDFQLPERIFGGTQDNNTIGTFSGAANAFEALLGGDGFHVNVDPRNSNLIYAESQWGNLAKSVNGGMNFTNVTAGLDNSRTNWNTPVVLSPIDPSIVYYGSYKLYKSIEAENWEAISDDLSKGLHPSGSVSFGTITTIAPSYSDLNTIYVGTDDGEVWVTRNEGESWNSINDMLPNRYVTEIAINPFDDAEAIVTLSGYRYKDYEPHVLITQNYGESWIDITSNLPDVPVNDIEYHHLNDNILYLGTDLGVWTSKDKGIEWELMSNNMPPAIINDLKIHAPTNTLYAGSFGRSIFSINIEEEVSSSESIGKASLEVYPNPLANENSVNVILPENMTTAELKIMDMKGRLVGTQVLNENRNRVELTKGVYLLRIVNRNITYSEKVIVH